MRQNLHMQAVSSEHAVDTALKSSLEQEKLAVA